MKKGFRSKCPIASTLDVLGDKWTLILVRDMLLMGKKTFKEFSLSDEGIAPGILSARLKWLEGNGLLTKRKLPGNQKENIYLLTERSIELAPVLAEMMAWSDRNLRDQNDEMYPLSGAGMGEDKAAFAKGIQLKYRELVAIILSGRRGPGGAS